jgi:hypothetical protein
MSEYREKVEKQAIQLDAEEWAKGIKQIHVHRLTSLWYETKDSIKDMDEGSVTDTMFNNGRIERTQNGKLIRIFGDILTGENLVHEYGKFNLIGKNQAQLLNDTY